MHRGLGQRELQFLDFGPLPALDEVPAAGALTAPSSIAALPASTKRLRHRLIDSVETPWRRASSAIVISPDITASTICRRVSTGTGSLDLLKIVSPVTVSS
jgi:hypothetical protein